MAFASLGVAGVLFIALRYISDARAAEPSPPPPVAQAADLTITLNPEDARIDGPNARVEGGDEKSIAWWTNANTSIHWNIKISNAGKYRVELNFAVIGNGDHGDLSIQVGSQSTRAFLTPGNGINDFKWGRAGAITIAKPGDYQVTAAPFKRARECVMYLRSLVLRPADSPSNAIDITGNPVKPEPDGTFKLRAGDGEISGMNAVLEGDAEKNIGFWDNRDTSVRWAIALQTPGKYRVEMNYSLIPSSAGGKVSDAVGNQSVVARPKPGAGWTDYKDGDAGEITLTGTGVLPVEVKPVSIPHEMILNLRSVTLAPVALPATAPEIGDRPVKQGKAGALKFTAEDAEIDGREAKLQGGDTKYIVWWGSRDTGITWPASVAKPGRFNVMVAYSLAETGSSSPVTVSAGGQSVTGLLSPTHGWDSFKTMKLGTLEIAAPGPLQLAAESSIEPGLRIANIRMIELLPAGK